MKAVLISIRPKWCELIASGKKTVEVRKTKPKLETPFKVYIYCTQEKHKIDALHILPNGTIAGWQIETANIFGEYCNGRVIGEFVCDRIGYVRNYGACVDIYDFKASCLSAYEIIKYATDKNGNVVYPYGWHISDLVIYEKPKELSEFSKYGFERFVPVKRPPQSWCYVEEQK